jgi:putative ABC transport system permease protein
MRVRDHAMQELLAGSGIAVGVALVFGVLVANESLTSSANETIHAVNGSAQLQLAARSSDGFSERLADETGELNGVKDTAFLLRAGVTIVGPHGRQTIQLVGVTPGLLAFGGSATKNLGAGESILTGGIGLPSELGEQISASTGGYVTVLANGGAHRILIRAVLNSGAIGSLADSRIAVALLPEAQRLLHEPKRVTSVLILCYPGAEKLVAEELRGLAAGRADVEPADNELRLLNATAKPINQSSALFAGISVMVGCLLAFNAMLLTVPERRKLIAEMSVQGYTSRQLQIILAFQAVALGIMASIAGIILGEVLAHTLFHQAPIYLTVAFPVSAHQTLHISTILIALGCGIIAALLASLLPVLDLWSGAPVDAVLHTPGEPGQSISRVITARLGMLGVLISVVATAAVLLDSSLTVVGGIMLALATVCFVPMIFSAVTSTLRPLSKRIRGSMLPVAVIELGATTTRSVALAGVAALAIYGSIAIGGARNDLIHGLNASFAEYIGTADIWVTTSGNSLTTNSFRAEDTQARLKRSTAIASVRVNQGGFLDVGTRRMWIIARPQTVGLPVGQLLKGDIAHANQMLRGGGWAAISSTFASQYHLHIGDAFALPTPSGIAQLHVAAITTNIGWPPGTVILNTKDYSRYWQTKNPTALEVDLKQGVSPTRGKRIVEQALQGRPGLRVQTAKERERQFDNNARDGLQNLVEISTLLLVMAALALALALSTVIWQRRTRLASLKTHGFDRGQLWRSLLLESAIVLSIGSADGAVLGIYGHMLANRWLRLTTGFPAPFSVGGLEILFTLVLVATIAGAVIAIPGYTAAGVPAQAGFQE